ncbi:sugar ABC transporter permease [Paenibacillus pasadenensis]|uniref:carbohydrate ABC transporter permease n=1 Tax=Paenibacillus pasadenensis TaxID=217090 RepID=UPI0020422FF0|nr:sugar ABC transporter permease [Paenibacillus pasadenensis]MCM3749051.1 sugar ABC transporter permease [Paenibacillus pasadenensis]
MNPVIQSNESRPESNEKSELRSRKRAKFLFRWNEYGMGYLFMLPWIIGFLVFMAFPICWSLYLTFNKVRFTGEGFKYEWIGLQNYRDALLKDNEYGVQIIAFFQQMILILPIIIIFALLVAILLNQNFPGRFIYRAIFFLPVIFSTGQVLTELFQQGAGDVPFISQYGIDTFVEENFSSSLAEPIISLLSMIIIILWSSGVQILIFIAGFQTVSRTIYEAVRIDGASPWESFWKITLPSIVPFIALNLLYTTVDLFTSPINPVMEQIRKHMFNVSTGYGYASALAWFYFLLIIVIIALMLWFLNSSNRKRRYTA